MVVGQTGPRPVYAVSHVEMGGGVERGHVTSQSQRMAELTASVHPQSVRDVS